ncbi:nucleotidyltransferase domain-containing protein, partial [Verrucomicrobiota bacterium]
PERVILFGSYANGYASDDSDVDLLVIMRHKKRNVEQALEIDRRIDRSFPLDLIVKTPQEIRRRLSMKDIFVAGILREGKILYERSH